MCLVFLEYARQSKLKMFSDYTINFLVYYNNLSTYYVVCVIISVFAIILSWLFHYKNLPEEMSDANHDIKDVIGNENINYMESEGNPFLHLLSTYKKTKQRHVMEDLTSTLTEEQLKEEKQAERQQLAVILELLKQQEDKFQVGSMEELEGQLKLYR